MKVTVVPAQVTTVEDRIAGSLGLSQLMLLAAPVFGGSALYVILPPSLHSATYKLAVIALLLLICGFLAIRIRGKIMLLWLVVILRHRFRPMYYVFDKNSLAGRQQYEPVKVTIALEQDVRPLKHSHLPSLGAADLARVQAVVENPAAHLAFKTNRKGGLNVLITQVQESGE